MTLTTGPVLQFGVVDDEGRHPCSGYSLSLVHALVVVQRGERHLTHGIHPGEQVDVNGQQAFAGGDVIDASFLGLRIRQVAAARRFNNAVGRVIFMNHARRRFVSVKMFLPNAQENRDIFLGHHVTFTENRPLALSRDNLSDILTEHAANSFLNRDSFNGKTHRKTSSPIPESGERGRPSLFRYW